MFKKIYKEILLKLSDLQIDFKVTVHNDKYITIKMEDSITWCEDWILMFNTIEIEEEGEEVITMTFDGVLRYNNVNFEELLKKAEWEY